MYPNYFLTKWPLIFKNNSTLLQSKEKNVWLTALQDQNLKKIRKCNQNYNLLRHDAYFTWIVSSEGKYSFTNNAFFLLDSKRHHKKTNWITKNVSIESLENCLFPENIAVLRKKEDYCSIHTETKSPNDILNQDRFLEKWKTFSSQPIVWLFLSLFPKNFQVWKRRKTAVTGVLLGCTILCDNHSLCNDFSLINEGFI